MITKNFSQTMIGKKFQNLNFRKKSKALLEALHIPDITEKV